MLATHPFRTSASLLLLPLLPLLAVSAAACGGGIAPSGTTGDGSGTSTGTSGTSGTSGGSVNSGASGASGATRAGCTVGSYTFCRCNDGSEGTAECLSDRSFSACMCNLVPPATPPPCSYPPADNPADCPGSYSHTYQGEPCPVMNLQCIYPGQGDGDANGCASTAGLQCRVAPGGGLFWTATQ
ncbi:MAG: hypothetical protein QOI41_5102 [Myxococcales bacterium]|nr:hypothetical protein [Myxococcales bacterium]